MLPAAITVSPACQLHSLVSRVPASSPSAVLSSHVLGHPFSLPRAVGAGRSQPSLSPDSLTRQTVEAEAQDRMELDRVRRHTSLSMLEVEERDAADLRAPAAAGLGERRCSSRTF